MSEIDPAVGAAFEDSAQKGRLVIRHCRSCDMMLPPDRAICPECWSRDLETAHARGTGTLYSKVVFHRAFASSPQVPYVVGQVQLDEGPRIIGLADSDIAIGLAVRVELESGDGGVMMAIKPIDRM